MSIIIGFLTVILVLNCLFLILLILIQLPKKDAGAGVAFGGGATEALFGAGSGNVLTKITKYAAGMFMGMALLLSVLNAQHTRATERSLELELERTAAETGQTGRSTSQTTTAPILQSTDTNLDPADPDAPVDQP